MGRTQHFMEPGSSSAHSQKPATCSYPEPDQSPHLTSSRSILILFLHLGLGLPSGLIPHISAPKSYLHLSPPPYALHALPSRSY